MIAGLFATHLCYVIDVAHVAVSDLRALRLDARQANFTFVKLSSHPEAQRAVIRLIARGMVTVPEAAQLAGVSRHLIRAWCKSRGMSVDRARRIRIAREWAKQMNARD